MQEVNLKQMHRLSIAWGIILVGIMALLTVFGIIFNKKNKVYKDMEDALVDATEKYVEKSFAYPKDNKELKVEYDTLKNDGFIDTLKIGKDECDGYVIVKKNELVYEYKAYVKCKEYKTKNYKQ